MQKINFKGKINYQVINSKKLSRSEEIRTITISDLHNYTNSKKRSERLSKTISKLEPTIILIAGDIFNYGKYWEDEKYLNNFKYFLSLLSKISPICITLGNHDLYGTNNNNQEKRLNNFYDLKKINNVYPLFNDRINFNNMEVVGYVPNNELMSIKNQIHGFAHDQFIKDYEKEGQKFKNEKNKITIFLGHNPHLISVSENNIGLGNLSKCDFFITGHLHDGYKPFFKIINVLKKLISKKELSIFELDNGLVEQPKGIVDKDGKLIKKSKKILGKTNLCRGIAYFDNMSQQRIWQSPDNIFYINIEKGNNKQKWVLIEEEKARNIIINDNLHYMLISEGIAPTFLLKEKNATINVVDIKTRVI